MGGGISLLANMFDTKLGGAAWADGHAVRDVGALTSGLVCMWRWANASESQRCLLPALPRIAPGFSPVSSGISSFCARKHGHSAGLLRATQRCCGGWKRAGSQRTDNGWCAFSRTAWRYAQRCANSSRRQHQHVGYNARMDDIISLPLPFRLTAPFGSGVINNAVWLYRCVWSDIRDCRISSMPRGTLPSSGQYHRGVNAAPWCAIYGMVGCGGR